MATEAAPKPSLGCGSQCECKGLGGCGRGCGGGVGVGVGVGAGVGVGVGVGVVWVRVGVGVGVGGWVVCGCVCVWVHKATSFYAWRSARQCQGMLPRSLFSLINFLPRTVPPGVSPLLAALFLKVFSTLEETQWSWTRLRSCQTVPMALRQPVAGWLCSKAASLGILGGDQVCPHLPPLQEVLSLEASSSIGGGEILSDWGTHATGSAMVLFQMWKASAFPVGRWS